MEFSLILQTAYFSFKSKMKYLFRQTEKPFTLLQGVSNPSCIFSFVHFPRYFHETFRRLFLLKWKKNILKVFIETNWNTPSKKNQPFVHVLNITSSKGHLISEQICEDIDFPKSQRNIC